MLPSRTPLLLLAVAAHLTASTWALLRLPRHTGLSSSLVQSLSTDCPRGLGEGCPLACAHGLSGCNAGVFTSPRAPWTA